MIGTMSFFISRQWDDYSCGARSAFMVTRHFGLPLTYSSVKAAVETTESGTSVKPMIQLFRKEGLRVGHYPHMSFSRLARMLELEAVVVVHLDGDHFGVVYGLSDCHVYLADPSILRQAGSRVSKKRFRRRWANWGLSVRE